MNRKSLTDHDSRFTIYDSRFTPFTTVKERFHIMIVAGEASGDAHAAALVETLLRKSAEVDLRFFGATGPRMRAVGVESIVNSDDLSILGLLEIGRALPKFWKAYKALRYAGLARKPDVVVLVDWPDFNLRLARTFHRRGIKVIYYISPQLWAWRSHRASSIKRNVDLMLAILPFETDWYRQRGVNNVEFVGHPLAGEVKARYGRQEFCRLHDLDPNRPIISLLPGSRLQELERILPPMLDAANLVAKELAHVQFVLVVAPGRSPAEAKRLLNQLQNGAALISDRRIVYHETREALNASDVAAVASGTATLEAALLDTPMVIVYKESAINWHTLGRLITADHYGLVNLIAGRRVVPELMQAELNGPRLASELISLLGQERNEVVRKQLSEVRARLGEGGASERAAERIMTVLRGER